MRTFVLLMAAIMAFTTTATYSEDIPVDDPAFSVEVSANYWSKYIFDGVVYSEDPVIQTDLFIGLPRGFYLDVWWSVGLDDSSLSSNFADELDYTIGWSGEIRDNLVIDTCVTYFDFVEIGTYSEEMVQVSAELSSDFELGEHTLTPFIEYEHIFTVNWSEEGGPQVNLGLRHSWSPVDKFDVSQQMQIIYDSGVTGFDAGFIGEYIAALNWQATEKMSVTIIQFQVSGPLESLSDSREGEVAIGCGLGYTF